LAYEAISREKRELWREKHIPVIEEFKAGVRVRVGEVPHSMEENHYIEWVEVISNSLMCRKFLKPGDSPEAKFRIKAKKARIYCDVHGLWSSPNFFIGELW